MHDLVVVINLDQHSLFVAQRHKLSSTHDTTEPHTPAPPNVINAASKKQARKQAGPQTHGGTRSMISALVARLTGFLSHQAPLRLSMGPADSAGASVSSAIPEGAERCTVAAGCFWGTEHLYRRHFGGKGLLDARVGYIGGDVDDPSYRAVCGGKTGRAFPFPPPLLLLRPGLTSGRTDRRRSRANHIRPRGRLVPPAARVLLPLPRPHDAQPPGPGRRDPVPLRNLLPRPGAGAHRPRRHPRREPTVVEGRRRHRAGARGPLVVRRGLSPALPRPQRWRLRVPQSFPPQLSALAALTGPGVTKERVTQARSPGEGIQVL